MKFALPAVVLLLAASPALSQLGVPDAQGFPSWAERVAYEWANRARSDPQVEMAACGANCTDAVCYTPVAPLAWANGLGHAARFHSDEMLHQSYLGHDSLCSVVVTINSAYPGSCNG